MDTPERYQRATELFHAALELAPDAREGFLVKACVDDFDILAAVKSMITAHERAHGFTGQLAAKIESAIIGREKTGDQNDFATGPLTLLASTDPPATDRYTSFPGQSIAHYKILSPLGKGGM